VKRLSSVLRVMSLGLVTVLAGVFIASAHAQMSDDPAPIIASIVEAYGGRAALESVKAVRHTGTIQSNRLGKTGTLDRLLVLPGQLRVDLNYPDGPQEQRITTPQGAWRDGKPATAPMHVAMQLQAARFRLPLLLADSTVKVMGEVEGLLRLGVVLGDATAMEVFVDPKTWHITRSVGHMMMGGMDLAFSADYSDFRPVGGVLFAHREELTAMGTPTGIAVLEKIELNPSVSAADFNPPQ